MNFFKNICRILIVFISILPIFTFASNISSPDTMLWGNKIGWVNFSPDNGNVTVTDSTITGYAWSTNYGWINLSPTNGGVINDGSGNLSGSAWGQNVGWINFSGVTINPSTGVFSGQTTNSSVAGILNFSCDNCSVKTSWRGSPVVNPSPGHSSSSGSSHTSSVLPLVQTSNVIDTVTSLPKYIYNYVIPDFLKPEKEITKIPSEKEPVLKVPLSVLGGKWVIFPYKYTNNFVLAPLPKEIRDLTKKFPDFGKVLANIGVAKITDLEKIRTSSLKLPNIADDKNLPPEVLLASEGLLKIASSIQISDSGEVRQKINTIVNKPIKLSVRPEASVVNIIGYLAFVSRHSDITAEIPTNTELASAFLAFSPLVSKEVSFDKIEKKMIVSSFAYTDTDRDGVYTAEIAGPQTEGEYEVITLIKYSDPKLGAKEMRLITVVDPEGYVFEKIGAQEARVNTAKVSMFKVSNDENVKSSKLWNAQDFNQENPQITDETGKYSFLVPEGEYYITVEASGYKMYKGDTFKVQEGNGVHANIELVRANSWLWTFADWRVVMILILGVSLIINFWNERRLIKELRENNSFNRINNN